MKNPVLNFFLLVLKISLNVSADTSQKQDRFSKTLHKKSLEIVLYKKDSIFAFNLSFVLLLIEINHISEEQGCKKDPLITRGSNHIKIILAL